MSNATYNGWTNYATWRVNLEIVDGLDPRETFSNCKDVYDLASDIREYCREIIQETSRESLARDYALAFLDDVNWLEIAYMVELNNRIGDET
jgi:hypothetical protein